MKYYVEDSTVEVVVNFVDRNGSSIEPTEIKATLFDGEDNEIIDFGSLPFEQTDKEKSIVIPSEFNKLQPEELQSARILRVELVTEHGTIYQSLSYIIETEQRLVIMNNTFQTYEAAEIEANNQPNLLGWSAASEEQKKSALVEAYNRLVSIPMRFDRFDNYGRPLGKQYVILAHTWQELTRDDFSEFPTHFKKVLRRAQLIEANELLQGDSIARKRRSGVITEKIGESWLTLRPDKLDYGVSNQTLTTLAGYIYYRMTVARA